jgi:hypothetical protein
MENHHKIRKNCPDVFISLEDYSKIVKGLEPFEKTSHDINCARFSGTIS